MGLIAAAASSAPAPDALALFSVVSLGAGGIFVTGLLAYLLGYLNIVEASDVPRPRLRAHLVSVVVPLAFVFAAIVMFQSLSIVGLL